MVIKELLLEASKNLSGLEYVDPNREAMFILSKILNEDISYIYLNINKSIDKSLEEEFKELVNLRKTGYPFHYIFKEKEFYDLSIYVEEGVLIPRFETEILVDYVIEYAEKTSKNLINIVEVGSGSGAIGVTIAKHIGNSRVTCLDISDTAIKVGNINKKRHNLSNIEFIKSDIFSNLSQEFFESTDIIISNPPYIETHKLEKLQKDVINFEPSLALDGGADGLNFYKEITKKSVDYLSKDGILVYEIGYNQAKEVESILNQNGFIDIKVLKDYQNHDRVIIGKKV